MTEKTKLSLVLVEYAIPVNVVIYGFDSLKNNISKQYL